MPHAAASTIRALPIKLEALVRRLSDGSATSRAIVCVLALGIVFLRLPSTFLNPEFWAEDGLLIAAAYNHGWASLFEPLGVVYFNLYGSLVANVAVQFPPNAWPWIMMYGAHLAVVIVVLVVTSPRFDLPYKALAALAVVVAPEREIFDSLANAQWLLLIVVFVIPYLRTSPSKWILSGEIVLAVLTGLEGPFVVFALPLYAFRLWSAGNPERTRLLILSMIASVCAVIQLSAVMRSNPFDLIEPAPYDWLVWLYMPIRWLDGVRAAGMLTHHHVLMAIVVVVMIGAACWLALLAPYRGLKIGMMLFATLILYSGMYKYRNHVDVLSNDRYVYAGVVFFFWFMLCTWGAGRKPAITVLVVSALVGWNSVRKINEVRPTAAESWKSQAVNVGRQRLDIPIAPADPWRVSLESKLR